MMSTYFSYGLQKVFHAANAKYVCAQIVLKQRD